MAESFKRPSAGRPTPPRRRPVFPVGLLAEGRDCLVVGGGTIGLRKIGLLLDASATITLVSPELHADVQLLVDAGRIGYIPRPFEPSDVDGRFVVFAATADRSVNRAVLAACRERGVYACSVDESWPAGDFVTPATVRRDDVVVAVSTGGTSCRRSRLIKNSLSRHLAMVESADLVVIGVSHEQMSLADRSALHLSDERLAETGAMLMHFWGVHEFALLNTCNRVECHAVVGDADGLEAGLLRILGFDRLPAGACTIKRGAEAFEHVALLAAGLLSQTPGEKHIVAQLKKMLRLALDRGWAGSMLQQWQASVFHVGKDIRGETEGRYNAWEVEDLALGYVAAERADWAQARVLVLGAGVVGRGLVERLAGDGREIDWFHRRRRPALPSACRSTIRQWPMARLAERLPEAEVVLCATAAAEPVLLLEHGPHFNPQRETVIVDLAMPRNVDDRLDGLDGRLAVVDLDDLKHWYRRRGVDLADIRRVAADIVAEHKDMYDRLIASFQGGNARQ